MFAVLRGAAVPFLRKFAPNVLGWGVQKLFNSIWGQTYLPKALKGIV